MTKNTEKKCILTANTAGKHMRPRCPKPMARAVQDVGNPSIMSRCAEARAADAKRHKALHNTSKDDEDKEVSTLGV